MIHADTPFLNDAVIVDWPALHASAVVPSMQRGLADAEAALEALTASDATPTYANTLETLEQITDVLSNAWTKVGHLNAVADSPEMREAKTAMLPEMTEFFTRITLNDALWQRIQAVEAAVNGKGAEGGEIGEGERALTPHQLRFLNETVADFKTNGAALNAEDKATLEDINQELSELSKGFGEAVLDATNAWELIIPAEEADTKLAGLPETAMEAAKHSAETSGHENAYRLTLHAPSLFPVMQYAHNAALRETVWRASAAVGREAPHENTQRLKRILQLRQAKAELLGKETYADFVTQRRMVGSGAAALDFVVDLHARVAQQFAAETKALEAFAAKAQGTAEGEGAGDGGIQKPLEPWSVMYYAEKMRKEQFDFDSEALRPYFPMQNVQEGLFALTEKLFGARAQKLPEGTPVWHESVEAWELIDVESSEQLGVFYTDWYPRETKRGGAWMIPLTTGTPGEVPHVGAIHGNMTPPTDERPALLTHDEVATVFHEFGHLLHHLLGNVGVKSLNGTSVAWDFVEMPSQVLENWVWEREGLDFFAEHYETGEKIPEELFEKMTAARNFRSASFAMRQLSFGRLDLELHQRYNAEKADDIDAWLAGVLGPYQMELSEPVKPITHRFTHLFAGGYGGGYYSYKWAEVLDADAFTRFQKEGILNETVGRQLRETIFSTGNSRPAGELFKAFMGREPNPEALLRREGLI